MYKDEIHNLIEQFPLEIDTEIEMSGRPPTMASSMFLTNKQQGDWAEAVVLRAINESSGEYFAVEYGRSESIAAGDPGFEEFYEDYQIELNTIGKKPDLLIFKVADFTNKAVNIENEEHIKRAVAAIEVRSSSFLSEKFSAFMNRRRTKAVRRIAEIRDIIMGGALADLLKRRKRSIYELISLATDDTFYDLDFRCPSWSTTPDLRSLANHLKEIKENIKLLHKRDYLSITPKIEDIALVNRWIQRFNIKHFYLQVFFDKAYVVSFRKILSLVSNDENEGRLFEVGRDVKNQGKRTIKINIEVGKEVLGKIDMPLHSSAMKELERGRLLFYVTFEGGKGYLDNDVFMRDIIRA